MRVEFVSCLIEEATKDETVCLLVGDLGFNVVEEFQNQFPRRFFNLGVSEQSMMGVAAGLASEGWRPFVYSIANFSSLRCIEQVRNDVAYENREVCIVSIGAGLSYGLLGYTHHGIEDLACLRVLPNMRVFTPCDGREVSGIFKWNRDNPGPSYLRLGRGGEPDVHRSIPTLKSGEPILIRSGGSTTVLVTGSIASEVLVATDLLADQGIEIPTVFSCPFSNLISKRFLHSLRNTDNLVIVEENRGAGGFFSFVLEQLSYERINVRTFSLNLDHHDIKRVGSHDTLRRQSGIDSISIAEFLKKLQFSS